MVSRNQTEFQYGLFDPPGGNKSLLSPAYIANESSHWWLLFLHVVRCACSFALARAGNKRLAKIAMIAMTTNNSIRVNANFWLGFFKFNFTVACQWLDMQNNGLSSYLIKDCFFNFIREVALGDYYDC